MQSSRNWQLMENKRSSFRRRQVETGSTRSKQKERADEPVKHAQSAIEIMDAFHPLCNDWASMMDDWSYRQQINIKLSDTSVTYFEKMVPTTFSLNHPENSQTFINFQDKLFFINSVAELPNFCFELEVFQIKSLSIFTFDKFNSRYGGTCCTANEQSGEKSYL